ncbi:hypothetical protein GTB64_004548 [Salmonella enterica]|nr:hypothetical protein [Salmonella enterica]
MLFKWQYAEAPGMGLADTLMMGDVGIGEVYQAGNKSWRAVCLLPDSAERRPGNFICDFPSKGQATGTLEKVCAHWLTKSGLWTIFGELDTLPARTTDQTTQG